MKIRRFFAPDMRQAIRMVREGQGPDAVILSSRRVEGGIEIVSAMDYDPDLVDEMAEDPKPSTSSWDDGQQERLEPLEDIAPRRAARERPEPQLDDPFMEPESSHAPVYDRPSSAPRSHAHREVVWSQDPTLVAMQREIESLRGMLQDQLASLAWNDLRLREPDRARLIHQLEQLGLDSVLAREIATETRHIDNPDYAWSEALQLLARRIPVAPEAQLTGEGVVALVGPSGVGKTTSVVKLAARYMQRHGQHSLALVTTDTYRIGAYRQLQTFGQLLGVPVYLAQTGKELGDILVGLESKSRIFVDTAGMSQRDLSLAEEMASLAAIPSLRTLLVIAANTQQAVLKQTFQAFSHLPLSGLVLTKVDEAASLGPVLSALNSGGLPMMYVSEGPRVSDDLQPARLQHLIDHAVALCETHTQESATDAGSRPTHNNLSRQNRVSA
jgi:flagellar biosynthesis protein FlhF